MHRVHRDTFTFVDKFARKKYHMTCWHFWLIYNRYGVGLSAVKVRDFRGLAEWLWENADRAT